jgi:hypothetical protein
MQLLDGKKTAEDIKAEIRVEKWLKMGKSASSCSYRRNDGAV